MLSQNAETYILRRHGYISLKLISAFMSIRARSYPV